MPGTKEKVMNDGACISVIIPAYNAGRWIGRAITSVLNQTAKPAEIIVVDDGSTDNTADVVTTVGERVRCIRQSNQGVAAARNVGIAASNGEWIGFLDSDDEWLPEWIQCHEHALAAHPQCKWCFCSFEYAGQVNAGMRTAASSVRLKGAIPYYQSRARGLRLQTSGMLVHRKVLEEVGYFNPKMRIGEDVDLWERIAMQYPEMAYCPEVCHRYWRDNESSLMRGSPQRSTVLSCICSNVRLSRSFGPDIASSYYTYARKRALSYIWRAAAGMIDVEHDVLREAKGVFHLSIRERLLGVMCRVLPNHVAAKMVCHCVD